MLFVLSIEFCTGERFTCVFHCLYMYAFDAGFSGLLDLWNTQPTKIDEDNYFIERRYPYHTYRQFMICLEEKENAVAKGI